MEPESPARTVTFCCIVWSFSCTARRC